MGKLFAFTEMKFFSFFGLAAMVLFLIPSLVFAKKPQKDRPDDVDNCGAGVCFMEVLSRMIVVILLIFVRMPRYGDGFAIAAGIALLIYYILWARYFIGGCHYPDIYVKRFLGIPVPMAICSVAYLAIVSLWLCNFYALVMTGVFGIAHIMNAWKAREDLLKRRGEEL